MIIMWMAAGHHCTTIFYTIFVVVCSFYYCYVIKKNLFMICRYYILQANWIYRGQKANQTMIIQENRKIGWISVFFLFFFFVRLFTLILYYFACMRFVSDHKMVHCQFRWPLTIRSKFQNTNMQFEFDSRQKKIAMQIHLNTDKIKGRKKKRKKNLVIKLQTNHLFIQLLANCWKPLYVRYSLRWCWWSDRHTQKHQEQKKNKSNQITNEKSLNEWCCLSSLS